MKNRITGKASFVQLFLALFSLRLLLPWTATAGAAEPGGLQARMEEGRREFSQMTCQGLERAIESFQKALALQPDSPEAHAWLGRAYGHLGSILEREGKRGQDLLRQGMSHARKAYDLSPNRVDACLAMADLALLHFHFSEAKKMAESAWKMDPENPWAAYLLWKATDPENPESPLLKKGLRPGSALAVAYLDQGEAFRRRGEPEKARQAYRKATQQRPPMAQAYFALASLCEEVGDQDQAIRELQEGLKIEDRLSLPYRTLAHLLREKGRQEEAILSYRRAIELNPGDFDSYLGLAKSDQATKSYEEALAALRQALSLNPQLPEAYDGMGEIRELQGRMGEAILEYEKAVALDPG
ncbi:MAG: tetratricopeptide repeat protein, partial [candidate division NC10 bacterium]|nr:tetratricopeptide repeat protein [candidate division NC10 bacterium]